MDIAAAPILADITVAGKPIKAVAVMGKQAMVYVFDRATGQPVWPIEERPVPQGDVPGEWYSPTQPFPTKPPPYDHQGVDADALIDFTPALRAEALRRSPGGSGSGRSSRPTSRARPTVPSTPFDRPAAPTGRAASYDPETHTLFVPSYTSLVPLRADAAAQRDVLRHPLRRRQRRSPGVRYVGGPGEDVGAEAAPAAAVGAFGGAERLIDADFRPQGLPLSKPPYGRLTAIDLDTRRVRVAGGARRDAGFRPQSPGAHGRDRAAHRPGGGRRGARDQDAGHCRRSAADDLAGAASRRDAARLRQGDGRGGGGHLHAGAAERNADDLLDDGRQYIVVAISGGNYSGEDIAFRLPQ